MVGALAVAAVAALPVAVVALGGGGGPQLNADPVRPARDAPATQGRGADGARVSIPTPGRPAIVTFLYTGCPDICPLAAQEISQALREAKAGPADIDAVAISVDPKGDTPSAVRALLERHRLTGRMRYIFGTTAQLRPLWESWQIAAQPDGAAGSNHSARIVLVDRDGRQAGAYAAGIPIDVGDLAAGVRALTG